MFEWVWLRLWQTHARSLGTEEGLDKTRVELGILGTVSQKGIYTFTDALSAQPQATEHLHRLTPIILINIEPRQQKNDLHQSTQTTNNYVATTDDLTVAQPTCPMTNYHTQSINVRELSSRLDSLPPLQTQSNDTTANNNMSNDYEPRRPRASSCESFRMPTFSKSSTMSTTDSSASDYSQLRVTYAVPKTKTSRESAEVGVGEFSKPKVHDRSRRNTGESMGSARSENGAGTGGKDFRYYGRHGNQWLFNDFSVTDAVRRGWGRVFGKDEVGDWYEQRN